jgi:hypothetical protein
VPSKHFQEVLADCLTIHNKKNQDYAKSEDPFSNFKFAATLTSEFGHPIDQVFACMIGIKLARIAELRNGKEPLNESLRDSHLDLINYCALWAAYYDSIIEPVR